MADMKFATTAKGKATREAYGAIWVEWKNHCKEAGVVFGEETIPYVPYEHWVSFVQGLYDRNLEPDKHVAAVRHIYIAKGYDGTEIRSYYDTQKTLIDEGHVVIPDDYTPPAKKKRKQKEVKQSESGPSTPVRETYVPEGIVSTFANAVEQGLKVSDLPQVPGHSIKPGQVVRLPNGRYFLKTRTSYLGLSPDGSVNGVVLTWAKLASMGSVGLVEPLENRVAEFFAAEMIDAISPDEGDMLSKIQPHLGAEAVLQVFLEIASRVAGYENYGDFSKQTIEAFEEANPEATAQSAELHVVLGKALAEEFLGQVGEEEE